MRLSATALAFLFVACSLSFAQDGGGNPSLTVEEAQALAKQSGPLKLNHIKSISPEVARALIFTRDQAILLDGLETLPVAVANELANHEGFLSLNGLIEVSDDAARALAQRPKAHRLELNGLKSLSVEAARSLARHRGDLDLDGLAEITNEVFAALCNRDQLALDGLTSLPDESCEMLARHEGRLSFKGLKTLTDAAAQAFSVRKGLTLSLDGVEMLPPDMARTLAQTQGYLSLRGLKDISRETAEGLAVHRGGLTLGLTSLSGDVAAALIANAAARDLRLGLSSVTKLSDETAAVLAGFNGSELDLSSHLLSVSIEAEASLRVNTRIRLPQNIDNAKDIAIKPPLPFGATIERFERDRGGLGPPSGQIITTIVDDGLAAAIGLRRGDVIVRVGAKRLPELDDLEASLIALDSEDASLEITYRRSKEAAATFSPGSIADEPALIADEPALMADEPALMALSEPSSDKSRNDRIRAEFLHSGGTYGAATKLKISRGELTAALSQVHKNKVLSVKKKEQQLREFVVREQEKLHLSDGSLITRSELREYNDRLMRQSAASVVEQLSEGGGSLALDMEQAALVMGALDDAFKQGNESAICEIMRETTKNGLAARVGQVLRSTGADARYYELPGNRVLTGAELWEKAAEIFVKSEVR